MAEESLSPFQTPETASKQEEAKSRRNSTGKLISSSNTGDKVLPRYLRASTGSCHDFCKYGGKHATEANPRRPSLKKFIKKLRDEKYGGQTSELLPQAKKKPAPKKNPVAKPGTCLDYDSNTIKKEVLKSPIGAPGVVPRMKSAVEKKDSSVTVKKTKKTTTFKPGSLTVSELQNLKNPKLRKQKSLSSDKAVSDLESSKGKEINQSNQRFTSLKQKSVTQQPKDKYIKTEIFIGTSKVVPKRVPINPRASSLSPKLYPRRSGNGNLSRKNSSKVESSLKNQKTDNAKAGREPKHAQGDPVKEKTLYVIKTEAEDIKIIQSDQNVISVFESSPPPSSSSTQKEAYEQESEYTVTEVEDEAEDLSDSSETENVGAEGEDRRRERKKGSLSSGDKTVELKFRRGKVVNVGSDDRTPRRLKFRKGKSLVESQKLKSDGRRSYKARNVEDSDGNDNSITPKNEKVVLRHQEPQEKNDPQGLFNNVIEETATKLVETRKSKVKALVGAFETVISLQETKTSGNNPS